MPQSFKFCDICHMPNTWQILNGITLSTSIWKWELTLSNLSSNKKRQWEKNRNGDSLRILLWNIKNVLCYFWKVIILLYSYPIHHHLAYDSQPAADTLWKQAVNQDFIDFSHTLSQLSVEWSFPLFWPKKTDLYSVNTMDGPGL